MKNAAVPLRPISANTSVAVNIARHTFTVNAPNAVVEPMKLLSRRQQKGHNK